jgi:hypothetical protein
MRPLLAFLSSLVLMTCFGTVPQTAHANSTVGQWTLGPVWDIAPIHMMVLPNGKVMFYPGNTINGDDPRSWDPATGTLTTLAKAGFDLFCTGHSFMTDGTMFAAGGNLLTPYNGLATASIYNPTTNAWTRLPNMNDARWYPTNTTLPNGDILVLSGMIDTVQWENPLPQIWDRVAGAWRDLTNAVTPMDLYPWMYVAPDGRVFKAGPAQSTTILTTSGTGQWNGVATTTGPYRGYGSSVMYDNGKVLNVAGGDPPVNSAEVIDLNSSTPSWRRVGELAHARRQTNATLLPDGKVLVTGGSSGAGFNDTTKPVFPAELWDPDTESWTTMASQTVGRFYHSVAVLLPDGRVFSAGGDDVFQTEIYSPPYLFKGARPTISSAPTTVNYGQNFFVGTPEATGITKAHWIRLPSVTHAFDMNQRINRLTFSQGTGGLNITAPSNPNLAPPGHYMLFLLNGNGVPSVAKIIQLAAGGGSCPQQPVNTAAAWVDSGFSYGITQNFGTPSDSSSQPNVSILRIFENGQEIGPAHSAHAAIRQLGQGRFSHWGPDLYLSATDNSDPRTNGKTYTYCVPAQ